MEVRAGYKQTEVGIIPEDWAAVRLGKVILLQRGYDLPHRHRRIGNIPIVSSSGISDMHDSFQASAPGVVTGRYGTIGDVYYIEENYWPLNTTLFVKDFKGNSPLYSSYLLRTIDFKSHSGKSGVPGVNRNDLHEIIVARPPLAEQTAIANALSDADALIQLLQKLIAKKRQLKQGAMQTLLNPFENGVLKAGWVSMKLGDLCQYQNGTSLEKLFNSEGGFKVISIGNYSTSGYFVNTETYINKEYATEVAKYVLQKNDLTMTMNDKTAVGAIIGRVLLIDSDHTYVYNQRTMLLRCKEHLNPNFAFHLINSDRIHKKIVNLAKPGTQIYVNTDDIVLLDLEVPNLDEQKRIAEIFSSIDVEIFALEAKLAKYQQIKQGMMQNLLTGRIRLV